MIALRFIYYQRVDRHNARLPGPRDQLESYQRTRLRGRDREFGRGPWRSNCSAKPDTSLVLDRIAEVPLAQGT